MESNNIKYDDVTNKGMLIIKDELYLIRDGKKMRVDAFIIKERIITLFSYLCISLEFSTICL